MGIARAVPAGGDAEADGHLVLFARDLDGGVRDLFPKSFRTDPSSGEIGVWADDEEFFTAEAASDVGSTDFLTEDAGDGSEDDIADEVAVGIVDLFEVIDVADDEGEFGILLGGFLPAVAHGFLGEAPVGELSEFVGHCGAVEFAIGDCEFGEVLLEGFFLGGDAGAELKDALCGAEAEQAGTFRAGENDVIVDAGIESVEEFAGVGVRRGEEEEGHSAALIASHRFAQFEGFGVVGISEGDDDLGGVGDGEGEGFANGTGTDDGVAGTSKPGFEGAGGAGFGFEDEDNGAGGTGGIGVEGGGFGGRGGEFGAGLGFRIVLWSSLGWGGFRGGFRCGDVQEGTPFSPGSPDGGEGGDDMVFADIESGESITDVGGKLIGGGEVIV